MNFARSTLKLLFSTALGLLPGGLVEKFKNNRELAYWRKRAREEGEFRNRHYEFFYTDFFGLEEGFYLGKNVLDIGCGPRGSLEWATMAGERVGIDPLADEYTRLNKNLHKMKYVRGRSEEIPYDDAHFDVVASFNNLDHCQDPSKSLMEISRVTASRGRFLLIVEVNHIPTPTEPHRLGWGLVDDIARRGFNPLKVMKYEIINHDIYASILNHHGYNDSDGTHRPGILCASFEKM